LFADLLSAHHPQPELLFQYGIPLVVPMLVAAGLGARRLLEWRPPEGGLTRLAIPALAVPALLVALLTGPLPRTPLAPSSARHRPGREGPAAGGCLLRVRCRPRLQ